VRGSILWGIIVATVLACLLKLALTLTSAFMSVMQEVNQSMFSTRFEFAKGLIALPPSLGPTFMKMDVAHALTAKMLPLVFVFLFMLTFDAIGRVAGAGLGTSTVTSFIESAAGVGAGGRTGLTGLVVAGLFLFALFFSPLIAMI
jgi:AGZA family xanthine/uracil permease-like MFS transporter